jgi:hypothetical protein
LKYRVTARRMSLSTCSEIMLANYQVKLPSPLE